MEPDFMTDHDNINDTLSEKLLLSGGLEQDGVDAEAPAAGSGNGTTTTTSTAIGEKQPNQYRDLWAAILFLTCQFVVLYLALVWGISSLQYDYNDNSSDDDTGKNTEDDEDSATNNTTTLSFSKCLVTAIWACIVSMVISGLALTVLFHYARILIQVSLCMSVICNVVVFGMCMSSKLWFPAMAAVLFCGLSLYYAKCIWHRIPFAIANLQTAITAIQTNLGILLVTYGMVLSMTLYSIIFVLAYIGVYTRHFTCNDDGSDGSNSSQQLAEDYSGDNNNDNDNNQMVCTSHTNGFVILSMLIVYYWTAEVHKNILQVTAAGVLGTFWFAPHEAESFCSPAVTDSFSRATTWSLGSICLGSLITAILQVLHRGLHTLRRHSDAAGGHRCDFLLCVLECLIGFLERLMAYFNKWAYVYIGLYGYDYMTAGKKVMSLFLERGWTAIINDNLVHRALLLVNIMVGALTGCLVGLVLYRPQSMEEQFGGSAIMVTVGIPTLIGTAMGYILMSVVSSAVDTVVVAFAEAPLEFERHHPGLSAQMVAAWRQVYPEEFGR